MSETETLTPPAPAKTCPYHTFPFPRTSVKELPSIFAELRAHEPATLVTFPSGDTGYLVTRYEDVRLVLSDNRFSRAQTIAPGAPKLTGADFPAGSLFTLDPPDHTRLRKLVAAEFTPKRIQTMVPTIQKYTDELLDTIAASAQPVDLTQALAYPLPLMVICELLGVPFEDRSMFQRWADSLVSLERTPAGAAALQQEMTGYFAKLIAGKREHGGDDLLSALVVAHDEHGKLNQMELIIMTFTLLVAGFETTVSSIGTGALTLLRHPEIVKKLLAEPALIDDCVEELLRLNPIGDGGPIRIALEDVEIAGVVIPKGSAVMAAVGSANVDDSQFPNPQAFDPSRTSGRHVAFSHGIHFCLGATLARTEMSIVLLSLFRRFPQLRLAVPEETLNLKVGMLVHRLEKLPVVW
jgi:cytochrome P450